MTTLDDTLMELSEHLVAAEERCAALSALLAHGPAVAVADVPADGSVDVRWELGHCRWSGWHHVVGEQRCCADCRHLRFADLPAGTAAFTPDGFVQMRAHVEAAA